MLRLKTGVRLTDLAPQMVLALNVADALWQRYSVVECVVTSCNDSTHKTGSKHYAGRAADLRSKNLPSTSVKHAVLVELREALGPDFDVLLESELTPNEHFHIEYDPKA